MNYVARAEGELPASFYSPTDGAPFDRVKVNFPEEIKAAEPLLKRTHDLRLLTIIAKFHALNRDLPQAVQSVEFIAELIGRYWDEVHPQAEEGDFSYRMACLQALDDRPHTVMPLSYAPFLVSKRSGPISLRVVQLATGEVAPREGETPLESRDLERAFEEIDLQALIDARDCFARLFAAVEKIREVWVERAGYDQAVAFKNLGPFASKARETLRPTSPAAILRPRSTRKRRAPPPRRPLPSPATAAHRRHRFRGRSPASPTRATRSPRRPIISPAANRPAPPCC